jgi:hypothetical protein
MNLVQIYSNKLSPKKLKPYIDSLSYGYVYLGSKAPANPQEGTVWIDTDHSGNRITNIFIDQQWMLIQGGII